MYNKIANDNVRARNNSRVMETKITVEQESKNNSRSSGGDK